MISICLKPFSRRISSLFVPVLVLLLFVLAPSTATAQRSKGDDDKPIFSEFRGVHLGMTSTDVRKKLGNPQDKGDDQDVFMFNDNEAVQVYYDKGAVMAISVNYMTGAKQIPTCKEILGVDVEAKADGSIYKLVRYLKAGYWVSWSRTAGNEAMVTITMQKIQ